jgi:putative transposase
VLTHFAGELLPTLNMRYRRSTAAGGTFFFTVNLRDRSCDLLVREVHALRTATAVVMQRHPFEIVAAVVMPEHLHAIWRLPPDDAGFAMRWALLKAGFSRRLASGEARSSSRAERRERGIWQRRYWEHQIRDDGDLERHVDYIHYNPVKHGHVRAPGEWPHSSIHRYVRHGLRAADWGADIEAENGVFGERP